MCHSNINNSMAKKDKLKKNDIKKILKNNKGYSHIMGTDDVVYKVSKTDMDKYNKDDTHELKIKKSFKIVNTDKAKSKD